MMLEATYVIVGGGIAGVSCAEGLSFLSPSETAILITPSSTVKAVTNVRPLAKLLTQFDVVEQETSSVSDSCPTVRVLQDTVTSTDYESHIVFTANGTSVKYKKLCICSGATPKLIARGNPRVIGIRDIDSVKDLQGKISGARKVLVVGNGGIATELVYEMLGVETVWAIKDKHIAAPFIDPGAAEFFWSTCIDKKSKDIGRRVIKRTKYTTGEGSGVALGTDWQSGISLKGLSTVDSISIEYETQVESILGATDKWPISVLLTNGKIIECDFVVSATGVIPNIEPFCDLKLSADGGISVDWKMETNQPDVFAAGDACTAEWDHSAHWFQMRLWTQARQMGTYAAKAMVSSHEGVPFYQDFCFELFTHVTEFFGFKVVLIGLFNGQKLDGGYEALLRVTSGVEYIKVVTKNGRLQGAVLIGETDLEETVENLVLDQLDVTPLMNDLLDPDIDIEDYFD